MIICKRENDLYGASSGINNLLNILCVDGVLFEYGSHKKAVRERIPGVQSPVDNSLHSERMDVTTCMLQLNSQDVDKWLLGYL